MTILDPKFEAFVLQMYKPTRLNKNPNSCMFKPITEAALYMTLRDGQMPRITGCGFPLDESDREQVQICHELIESFLQEEYERLEIASMPKEEIEKMKVTFSSSTSVGWGIPSPAGMVYIKATDQAFDKRKHFIIPGCNPDKSASNMDEFMRIETLPYITTLNNLAATDEEKDGLIELNTSILSELRFDGDALSEIKTSDFGFRLFYCLEGGIWKQVKPEEEQGLTHNGSNYTLPDNREVQVVPYMLDTDNLRKGISREQQRAGLLNMFKSSRLHQLGPERMPIDQKRNIIGCYLALDAA